MLSFWNGNAVIEVIAWKLFIIFTRRGQNRICLSGTWLKRARSARHRSTTSKTEKHTQQSWRCVKLPWRCRYHRTNYSKCPWYRTNDGILQFSTRFLRIISRNTLNTNECSWNASTHVVNWNQNKSSFFLLSEGGVTYDKWRIRKRNYQDAKKDQNKIFLKNDLHRHKNLLGKRNQGVASATPLFYTPQQCWG